MGTSDIILGSLCLHHLNISLKFCGQFPVPDVFSAFITIFVIKEKVVCDLFCGHKEATFHLCFRFLACSYCDHYSGSENVP